VIWQRFFNRTLDEFFGRSSKAFQSPAFFSSALFEAYWATIRSLFLCLAFTDVFAIFDLNFQEPNSKFQNLFSAVGICDLKFVIFTFLYF
jgi:hypothetical protein